MKMKKEWIIAVSVATAVAANGMATVFANSEQEDAKDKAAVTKRGEFRGDHKAFKEEADKLLAFLKIDEATFKADMKAGKTLVAIAKEQGISEQELKDFMISEMTQRLDAGVAAGRITQDQADKMKANMDKHVTDMINGKGPMMKGGMMAGHAPFANEKLLALLKIDANTLKSEMKAGKTLAAIAKEHGVSEKKLKDFLVSDATQRIDQGVKDGRIPADRAEKMKANMADRVAKMINEKGSMMGHGPKKGHGFFGDEKLLSFLKIDKETLKNELKDGKTLVAIAGEHGISEQDLKTFMIDRMNERIDEGVKAGRIDADKAGQMKANMEQRVSDMINGKAPMHKHQDKQNS